MSTPPGNSPRARHVQAGPGASDPVREVLAQRDKRAPWAAGGVAGLGGRSLDLLLVEARRTRSPGLARLAWKRFRGRRGAQLSALCLVLLGALSFLAPLLPLRSPIAMQLSGEPRPPTLPWVAPFDRKFSSEGMDLHGMDAILARARGSLFGTLQIGPWLGTDSKGRDLLARLVWGSRTSILVSLAATLVSLVIGVTYGGLAGLWGGRVDRIMMRAVDVLQSLPFVFLVIFVLTLLGGLRGHAGFSRQTSFFAVLGMVWWLSMARVVRGQVLSLRQRDFVLAARAMGAGPLDILRRHILPNVLSVVIVYLTLTIPSVMLFEAFLSFLGLGIEPPGVSWGLLAADGIDALQPLKVAWWLVLFPALALSTTLFLLNVLGDGLRDALDARHDEVAR